MKLMNLSAGVVQTPPMEWMEWMKLQFGCLFFIFIYLKKKFKKKI